MVQRAAVVVLVQRDDVQRNCVVVMSLLELVPLAAMVQRTMMLVQWGVVVVVVHREMVLVIVTVVVVHREVMVEVVLHMDRAHILVSHLLIPLPPASSHYLLIISS